MSIDEAGMLWAASMILRKEAKRGIPVPGLTMPQASLLGVLGGAGRPLTATEISRRLMQESQSTTMLVDRMCVNGLVERVKDPGNRHVVLIRLTEEGARISEILLAGMPGFTDDMFGVLSTEERATLRKLLLRFVERNIQHSR
jgi:MarR family transcriptional regulator, organic hydroperoxide resistance regulator